MRWLLEAWNAARQARREGIDVRAVTAWSAFGSTDWNSLVTRNDGRYEPGPVGQPLVVATAHRAGRTGGGTRTRRPQPSHPLLPCPGWWKRHGRLEYPAHGRLRASRGRPAIRC